MKTLERINPKGEQIFRNKVAAKHFDKCSADSYVYESGIDKNGKVYFAKMNGIVERSTRSQFIKLAEELNQMKTYRVTYNYSNGDAGIVGEFSTLEEAIKCFDQTDFAQNSRAYEIEIKKFVADNELEEFELSELPAGYEQYEGWFIKTNY